ncbi:MAG: LysR family transcriptional regulator [Pseudomonadota bacterium]|nr:LysR family transcriptional regulator [Pseudomonadota bacterium]
MENWDDFRLILALARSGSLRAAANDLNLTHTTVARRLASLQDRRGDLFEKGPGGYSPTALGRALVEVAESMERLTLEGARYQRSVDQDISGKITLSLPEAIAQYLLLDEIVAFCAAYSAIDLRVETSYRFVDLDRSEADIVVRGAQEPPEHLVGRRLFPYYAAYYGNREYIASTPVEKLRWIAPSPESRSANWLENSPFPDAPVVISIDDITARHKAVVAGLGLSRDACFMADPEPDLVRLSDDPPQPLQDLWVLTHPDLRHSPRVRLMMDFISQAIIARKSLVTGGVLQG